MKLYAEISKKQKTGRYRQDKVNMFSKQVSLGYLIKYRLHLL